LLAIIALNLSTSVKVVSTGSASNDFLLQDKVVYETAAHKLLAKSIWNRNKLTVDTDKASAELAKQFPELSAVSITLPLLANKPVVHVQPAQPALILAAHNGSYVVDTSGKVLLMSANVPKNSNLQLPTVTDQSNFTAVINRQALTEGDVRFIQIVVAQLTAKGNRVASLMLPSGASELDVHLVGQPYFVKFNLERNEAARQQAGTFLATQAQLKKQNITPAQYVDVRVEGRAYYK
jgi:cell division septal protein FtsQ